MCLAFASRPTQTLETREMKRDIKYTGAEKVRTWGTPRRTHLSLGYASTGLSRQAGGEKHEGDALKVSSAHARA